MNKEQVIAAEREAYAAFTEAIAGLSDEELARPVFGVWGVREVLAHLAGWHATFADGLERMARGERPTPPGEDWSDIDGWNERFAATVGGRSGTEMIAVLAGAVERLLAAAGALPEERFGAGKTASAMAEHAGFAHLRDHAAEISALRASGGFAAASDPRH